MSAETEQATERLTQAEAALATARQALEGERKRAARLEADLLKNDSAMLQTDPEEAPGLVARALGGAAQSAPASKLVALQGERLGLSIALEVVKCSRIPAGQAALARAEAARAEALRGVQEVQLREQLAREHRTVLQNEQAAGGAAQVA